MGLIVSSILIIGCSKDNEITNEDVQITIYSDTDGNPVYAINDININSADNSEMVFSISIQHDGIADIIIKTDFHLTENFYKGAGIFINAKNFNAHPMVFDSGYRLKLTTNASSTAYNFLEFAANYGIDSIKLSDLSGVNPGFQIYIANSEKYKIADAFKILLDRMKKDEVLEIDI